MANSFARNFQPLHRKNILCSAQTFGFGPISKLFQIARGLQEEFSLTLVLNSDLNVFPLLNPGVFSDVIYIQQGRDFDTVVAEIKPDAVLSSYDLGLVLAGKRNRTPSYFFDGLFWFWVLTKSGEELGVYGQKLIEATSTSTIEILADLTPHERVFISHYLARKSYIQWDPRLRERLAMFENQTNMKIVGAVVHQYYPPKSRNELHVLVTLNGGILPTVSIEQSANYVRLVLAMIARLSEMLFGECRWIVLVNPMIMDVLRGEVTIADDRMVICESVDQETMHHLQEDSIVVLTPPGLTTICECAALHVPTVFLPEQSVQYKTAYRLREYGYPVHGGFFCDVTGTEPSNDDIDGIVSLYQKVIPSFLKNPQAIFERLFEACKAMENPRYRRRVAAAQTRAVLKMVGNFDGASQISSDIKRDLGSGHESTHQ